MVCKSSSGGEQQVQWSFFDLCKCSGLHLFHSESESQQIGQRKKIVQDIAYISISCIHHGFWSGQVFKLVLKRYHKSCSGFMDLLVMLWRRQRNLVESNTNELHCIGFNVIAQFPYCTGRVIWQKQVNSDGMQFVTRTSAITQLTTSWWTPQLKFGFLSHTKSKDDVTIILSTSEEHGKALATRNLQLLSWPRPLD